MTSPLCKFGYNDSTKTPDDALSEVLAFFSFPELQRKALLTRQTVKLACIQVGESGEESRSPSAEFSNWRHEVARSLLMQSYHEAEATVSRTKKEKDAAFTTLIYRPEIMSLREVKHSAKAHREAEGVLAREKAAVYALNTWWYAENGRQLWIYNA